MKKLILLIGVIFFFISPATADEKVDLCHYSTEGTDFWFGLMQNRNTGDVHYLEITVTSRIGAEVTVTYGPNEILIGKYKVFPNSSIPVSIDYRLLEPTGSEVPENKGIHLVSTNPVNVYALNYRTRSADVAVIYPSASLGKEYFAMCFTPFNTSSNESNSEFLIVASADNTIVQITPSVDTDQGKKANSLFSVLLNKGQSYQVQSSNSVVAGQGDLTGSYISSDKPIAFYSGSKATCIPTSGYSYDYLYEQIPPTITWGKEFYMVPLKQRTKDTYRILASEDNTIVTIEGINQTQTLRRGEFYQFELTSSQACRITSTKKILLAQFCNSQGVDGNSGVGDPFMIIISPVVQKINDVTFVAYESNLIRNIFFVNIITYSTEIGNITLDGLNISSYFSSYPNGVYSYAQVPISKGTHQLQNNNENGGFLAFVYGFGENNNTESYGYGVGFNLDIQLEIVGNWTTEMPVVCQGTEVKLEVRDFFDTYLWSTGETTPSITVSKEGKYKITGTTSRGCVKSDSLYLRVSNPEINLGNDTSSCGPGEIILDAGNKFKTFLWQDGSTSQTFPVMTTGNYSVTGINEFGCQTSDAVHVDVFRVPEVKITGDTIKCGVFPLTLALKVEISNADSELWNYSGAAKWTSTPANSLFFENINPEGVTVTAYKPGLYMVNYELTTIDGCKVSDSFQVGYYEIPESTFEVISPVSTDKCSTYERVVKYTGRSGLAAKFIWDFGGLMVLDTIIPDRQFKVSIGVNNPNRAISLVVEENGCTSQPTTIPIGVLPNFEFGADVVHGCDKQCVQFNSKMLIDDDVRYSWSFGDGGVSTEQKPLHCYQDTGKFDVSLMVTNAIDGCQNGWTEKEMIKIIPTPKAVISVNPEICYGDTVSFEYLNAKDYSNCKWFAKGNEILSQDNTKATYFLKNEISEVGFLVEENGCSSDTLKVLVKRKPNFDFKANETEICLPDPVTLKAIPKDPDLKYTWSVGSLPNATGESVVSNFALPGFYSVTLKAVSGLTGCSDSVTIENFIQVHASPKPKFNQNYPIATLEHPEISFYNQSQGAVSYLWNFGDGTTDTDANPVHKYESIGEYEIVMQAFSEFGCTDSISSTVKIIPFSFFIPNAFRPDSDIPENRIFLPFSYIESINPEKYLFEVYNRLGSVVFETTDPLNGWTGKSTGGAESEPGVYVWMVKYSDIQGYEHLQKGTVMLVR